MNALCLGGEASFNYLRLCGCYGKCAFNYTGALSILSVNPEQTNLVLKAAFNICFEYDDASDIWSTDGRVVARPLSVPSCVPWTFWEQDGTQG